jgi:ankyrin repeat protein
VAPPSAEINDCDKLGRTALMKVAMSGDVDMLKLLIDRGADRTLKDQHGATAQMLVASLGKRDTFPLLILAPDPNPMLAARDRSGRTVFMMAAEQGSFEGVTFVMANVPPDQRAAFARLTDQDGKTALNYAVGNKHQELATVVVEYMDPKLVDVNGQTALMRAAATGELQVAGALLDAGADIQALDKSGNNAVVKAAQQEHERVVELLLARGADRNGALVKAAQLGHAKAIPVLLAQRAAIDFKDAEGSTALIHAVANGHLNCVKVLLEKQADVNVTLRGTDQSGQSFAKPILQVARELKREDIVKLLKDAGAK